MKSKSTARLPRRSRINRVMFLVGLASLVLVAGLLVFSLASNQEAAAKDQAKVDQKDLVKSLKIVSVDHPASFQGVGRYPTIAQKGQRLLAVTVDFDRDFKSHLRSSEAGEVYLTGNRDKVTYYTVDTGFPKSEGPGKKPTRQATFVFAVPQASGQLTFHYGQYNSPLPEK